MPADPMPHPSAAPHHQVPGAPLRVHGRGEAPSPFMRDQSATRPNDHATPPKAGPINKLRGASTPKDTIPIAKTPRKQRSSRFHVSEKVEIQRLPSFMGALLSLEISRGELTTRRRTLQRAT